MNTPSIVCLPPVKAAAKCGRSKSWIWDKTKSDPDFPPLHYIGSGSPVFFEHELDAWILAQDEKPRVDRGARARAGQGVSK